MGKKKILAIACMPFYHEKGSSLRLYSILKILSKKYDIDLVTYSLGEDVDIENVRIFRTCRFFKPPVGVSKPSFAKIVLDILVFFKSLKLILFSSKKYSVVHCEDFEAVLIGSVLKKVFRKKIVYALHNRVVHNWEISGRKMPKFISSLEKRVISSSDLIIANWKMYLTDPVFKGKKIFLHYDSVDTKIKKCDLPFKKYFFYSGNFEKYQGIFDFLRVYKASGSDVPVVLAGEPNEEVVDFVKKNDLSKKIVFVGKKSVEETNFLIKNSFCCLLPRVSGIQPSMKMIHYLIWEKPVIAKNISCNTELIKDGYNGFLYGNDPEFQKILVEIKGKGQIRSLEKGLQETRTEIQKLVDKNRFLDKYI